jgi:5'-nucleotidase
MNILLTNDDGIYAEGLWALYRCLSKTHTVTVVAPDRERSAVGHGITLHRPIRAVEVSVNGGATGYAVSGTPADCVKLGVLEMMSSRPDLVISGINPGANVGVNINYSGTVSAAREAALYGLAAIAVSVHAKTVSHYADAAVFVATLADQVIEKGLPFGTILNVNLPDLPLDQTAGVRISRQGLSLFSQYFEKRHDPRNQPYYWQGCDQAPTAQDPDVDEAAICLRYISVTPIRCDMTDYGLLETLKAWNWPLFKHRTAHET